MKLPVLTAADGAAWEERLVAAFDHGPYPVEIARRCVDVVDLLAVAASGQGRAALITARLRRLDIDAVDRLIAAGVVPVGVPPRGDASAEEALRSVGIEHLVPADADAGVVASVLVEAVRAGRPDATGAPPISQRAFGDPTMSMPIPPGSGDPLATQEPMRQGSVVAVWGPTGAPGRTTVAVTLADEVARLGAASLLVDADVYGGTIAAVLGLLDESPGLAAACRQAAGHARLNVTALAALCWQLGPQLRVLTGLPLAARWPEVRPAAIPAVLAAARSLADFTIVDCGFCLETDEELSFDTVAPRRNGATLAVLDDADVIVAVGAADPIGMQRLVRGLGELRDTEVTAPVWVVLNRMRDGAVPGDAAAELTEALQRFAGRTPAALLPADPRSIDAAVATGRLLSESSPASPFRRSVVELAAALAGVELAAPRRRWRR
jgi:MinD-like ATPase involved in chromosome partitioning or flagellar assembly